MMKMHLLLPLHDLSNFWFVTVPRSKFPTVQLCLSLQMLEISTVCFTSSPLPTTAMTVLREFREKHISKQRSLKFSLL